MWPWPILYTLLKPLGFLAPKSLFKLFDFIYFDFERTWGMLFQKRVVHTIFYIYSTFLYFDKTIYNVLVARICGKKLHDRIIFLREEVRTYKTSLIPPHFIEVPVPSQEREQSCICVRGHVFVLEVMYLCVRDIDFAFVYDFSVGFWKCSHSVVFWCFCFSFFYI